MKKLKLLDTFSGIGGFSYAAEKLVGGFKTTQFIEIDPYCQKVLKKHWPKVPIHDDIRTFTAKPFQYDAVCGGFPCQDISTAGRGKGITQETRSGLFYELIRVIRMVRPKFVILENVAAILNNGMDIVLGELSEAGYDAEWAVISASSLGACHQRSRWWLVAYPNIIRCGGGSSERHTIQKWLFLQREQEGGKAWFQTERCDIDSSNTKSKRLEGGSRGLQNKRLWADPSRYNQTTPDTVSQRTQIQYEQRGSSIWNLPSSYGKKGSTLSPNWQAYESEPCLRRGNDGLSNWTHRLKALGNSVVPQVAAIPLQRVKDIHEQLTSVDH